MDIINAGCDFPWSGPQFAHLGRLITSVDQFLEVALDLQAKDIENEISLETDPVAVGEMSSELAGMHDDDWSATQRVVWGGLLVTIYAAFESGLEQIFEQYRTTIGCIPFKAKPSVVFDC